MTRGGVFRSAMPTAISALIAIAICVPIVMWVSSELDIESSTTETLNTQIAAMVALAVAVTGVLAWCAHRGMAWRDSSRLTPLWSMLAGRPALLTGYAVIVAVWAVLCTQLGVRYWPELLASGLSTSGSFFGFLYTNDQPVLLNGLFALAFVLTQAAFLWSGGKLRIGGSAPKPYRLAVSAAIFALAMSVLTMGLVSAVLEGVDRMDTSSRPGEGNFDDLLGGLLVANWIVWLPIAWFALRGVDRPTGLSRLAGLLLAGSWIEVAVALPIELVRRGRHESCPCESGSWLALVFAGPILLWSIGPAVYLLYLRERALEGHKPGHARRVLARKSAKVRPKREVEAS